MADEETVTPFPAIAWPTLLARIERMTAEGLPGIVSKQYMDGMKDGTQFQYRQAFRHLGLTDDDDRPTPLLAELVRANDTDRRELVGKIMLTGYPDLTALPLDATRDDFFAVLVDRYRVNSDQQRRKMLTFFVNAADYAGLEISPDVRPLRPGTAPRAPKPVQQPSGRRMLDRRGPTASRADKPADRPPAVQTGHSGREADAKGATGQDISISLGDVGSVSVALNVDRWWDLPDDQLVKLRKLIKDVEALRDSGF